MSMPSSPTPWTRPDFERLLALSTALADLTLSTEMVGRIPAAIVGHLGVEPTTLAILRTVGGAAEIEHLAVSTPNASAEAVDAARRRVLDVYAQTKPLAAGDAPVFRDAVAAAAGGVAVARDSGELVVCRSIHADHRLLLIVTQRGEAPSPVLLETLDLVCGHLVRLLGAMLSWVDDPSVLGQPFDRLTDREWVVLQGLQSEDGEKQLADKLELSPHTLHSHIKSIYRKLGVQGRLPVLMRLASAQRTVRARLLATRPATVRPEAAPSAIAAG